MTLRIDNQGQQPISNAAEATRGTLNANNGAPSVASSHDSDTMSIGSASVQLSGDVPIRQDKVAALRAQVESGTYSVDARAVATAMFQNLFRS